MLLKIAIFNIVKVQIIFKVCKLGQNLLTLLSVFVCEGFWAFKNGIGEF